MNQGIIKLNKTTNSFYKVEGNDEDNNKIFFLTRFFIIFGRM